MKRFFKVLCFICALLIALCAVACGGSDNANTGDETQNGADYNDEEQSIISAVDYDFETLSLNTAIPEDATIQEGSETEYVINAEGDYVLRGTFSAGVSVKKNTGTVHIYLNGANITYDTDNAFAVKTGNTAIITVVEDTTNTITGSGKNGLNSNGDLYINGTGTLTVSSTANNALKVDAALKIVDATLNLSSTVKNALSAYNVSAKNCTINVSAAVKDGIHAEMDDAITAWTESDGFVALFNVNYTANVEGDGIQADTYVYIDGGEYNINTTASFVSYSAWQADTDGKYDLEKDDFKYAKSGTAYVKQASKTITNSNIIGLYAMEQSSKGIKVGEIDYDITENGTTVEKTVSSDKYYIFIVGGTFNINSDDDAVHANSGNITVDGGIFTIETLDDGLTADLMMKINGGTISVNKCFEGIEGGFVEIYGGTISLVCSDDGINASSDDKSVSIFIKIYDGDITINAQGDGIDSNGTATIYGGTVCVFGPTSGGNSALDSEGSVLISGGTVVAISMQVMDGITCNKPYVSATNVSLSNGNTVSINGVVSVNVPKSYNGATVIICSENLTSGTAYTLRLGTRSTTVSAKTGSLGGMGGGGRR